MEDDEAKLRTRVHNHFVLVKSKKGIKEIFKQTIDLANDNDSWLHNLQVAGLSTYCSRSKSAKAAIREAARSSSFPKWSDAVWEGHIFHLVSDNMALEKAISSKKKTDKEIDDSTSSFACFESTSKVKTMNVSQSDGSYSGSDDEDEDEDDASSHGEEMTTTMDEGQRAVSGAQEGRSSALTISDKEDIANTSSEKSSLGETHQNLGVAAVFEPPLAAIAGALDPQKFMNKSTMVLEKRTNVGPFSAATRTNGWGGFTSLHNNSIIPNDDVGPQQPAVIPPTISAGALDPQRSTMVLENMTSVGPFSPTNRTNGGGGGFTSSHNNSIISNDEVGPQQPAGLVSHAQSGKTFDTQYRSIHMGSSNKSQPPAVPKRPTYASKVIGVVNSSRFGKSMAGADWPPMLTSNPISKVKLHYMDPGTAKQSHKIKVPSSCAQRIEEWANCLVGYFIGNSLTYSLVCSIAHMHWHTLGLKEVKGTENGFYIFKFATLEAKDAVMEGGPWDFSGQPIILKKWNRNLILAKEKHTKVPIWVKLYNLPLEYWGKDGLSLVTSMIGNPLHPDAMTETCNRISYARVYVEIDINSELLGEFEIEVEDEAGNPSHILIKCEYQWQPMKCMECKCFGHDCSQPTPSAKTKVPAPRNTKGPQRMEWQPVRNKNPRINESLTQGDTVNKGKEKVIDTNHKSDSNVFEVLNSMDTEEQPAFDVQCAPQSQHKAENLRTNTPDQIQAEECGDSSLYSSHDELDDLIDEDAPSSSRKGGSNSKKKKKNKKNKRRR